VEWNLFQVPYVEIGGEIADLLSAGNAPGIVEGLIQLNARLPLSLREGANEIRLAVGVNRSPSGVSIWVR